MLAAFLLSLVSLFASSMETSAGPGFENYINFFQRTDYIHVLLRTLYISGQVTLLCLIIGFPIAYLINLQRNKTPFILAITIPWFVSIVVRTYGWMVILGTKGTLNSILITLGLIDSPAKFIFNSFGITIGLVHVLCPFMIFSILSSLAGIDKSMVEASLSLRATSYQIFRHVIIPLAMPGIISGVILTYLLSTGAIVTPLLLGGVRDTMLATQIYQDIFQLFQFSKAAAMAFILVAAALLVILPIVFYERRRTTYLRRGD